MTFPLTRSRLGSSLALISWQLARGGASSSSIVTWRAAATFAIFLSDGLPSPDSKYVTVDRGTRANLESVAWVIPLRRRSSMRFAARCRDSGLRGPRALAIGQYISKVFNILSKPGILGAWKEAT